MSKRITVIVDRTPAGRFVVIAPTSFLVDGRPVMEATCGFDDQSAAEHHAAGVAAGLRACGRSCEVVIDVPEETPAGNVGADGDHDDRWQAGVCAYICEGSSDGRVTAADVPEADDAEDMLDMGALDQWAQQRADRTAIDPEADPVERRLAREAEAGRFIAEVRGL